MKLFRPLLLALLLASTSLANTRTWKEARVVDSSETDVSGELHGSKHTMHYTIETEDRLYFLDYTYTSNQHATPPTIAVNVMTKIAVEGHHAYLLDAAGKEVKFQIVKKSTNKH
jgi:hypothetical protein